MAKDELRIFTPIGMLGYGFSEAIFWSTMAEGVDAVILDAGSTDSGPSKLALGKSTGTRKAYEQDLRTLVAGCHVYRKPLLIGRSLFTVGVSFLFFSFLFFLFFFDCLLSLNMVSRRRYIQVQRAEMAPLGASTCSST